MSGRSATWLIAAAVTAALACSDNSRSPNSSDPPAEPESGPSAQAKTGDVSGLKVSRPSAATAGAAAQLGGDLEVVSFVPPGDVADQIAGYVAELGKLRGSPISFRELDRMLSPDLAKQLKATRDDVVVLVIGDRSERILIGRGGRRLTELDARIAGALAKLRTRGQLVWLEGSGSVTPKQLLVVEKFRALSSSLGLDWSPLDADSDSLPAPSAVVVYVDGLSSASRKNALALIDRHLEAGGSALLLLEPRDTSLGPLSGRLGLALDARVLVDAKQHVVIARTKSDRANITTNKFKAHPATASAARASARTAMAFLGAGSFQIGESAAVDVLVESMDSSFRDANGNLERDSGEQAGTFPIAVAAGDTGMRVVLYADADWLNALAELPIAQLLFVDSVRWLARFGDPLAAPSPDDVELTTYPARKRPTGSAAPAPIWSEAPGSISAIHYAGERGVLALSENGGSWSGTQTRAAGDAETSTFVVEPELAAELTEVWAAPVPLRDLGQLDQARWTELGLSDGVRLAVTSGGSERVVAVGQRVYGGTDRFAGDPETRRAWVMPGSMWRLLDGGADRLELRDLLGVKTADIDRVEVESAGDEVAHLARDGESWRRASRTADDPAADALMAHLGRMRPASFQSSNPGKALASIRLYDGADLEASLELFVRRVEGGTELWARSHRTAGAYARLPRLIGDRLQSLIEQVGAR